MMKNKIFFTKLVFFTLCVCILVGAWFVYSEIYTAQAQYNDKVNFEIKEGLSVEGLAQDLEEKNIIRNATFFKLYARLKGMDRQIRQGEFEVEKPITLARVMDSLSRPGTNERTITIIPGWDLRDISEYFEKQGISNAEALYAVAGKSAYDYARASEYAPQPFDDVRVLNHKSDYFGLEGYLAPDTYRIFKNATITDIVFKLLNERDSQFTEQMYADIEKSDHTVHEILTMASILEREVRSSKDRKIVSDLFWRRLGMNWALQADSTVHYAVNKKGDVFTTAEDRASLSPWNTYKYPGLPPGPICNPSLDAIMAAIYPEKNDYWYFMTTPEGEVKYGKTLEEHNQNVNKYLR